MGPVVVGLEGGGGVESVAQRKEKKDIPGIPQSSAVPTTQMDKAEVGESSAAEWRSKDTLSKLAPILRGMRERVSLTNKLVTRRETSMARGEREGGQKKRRATHPQGGGQREGEGGNGAERAER